MSIKKEKYKEAIIYLCSHLNNEVRGKKKLAKLLYFVDFDLFESEEKVLTGDVYKAFPMGPFPQTMEQITSELEQENAISIETIETIESILDYNPTEVYKCKRQPDISIFESDEIKILDRVIKKYGHLNGKQLEDLTHAEAPYVGTEAFQEIPYELAYYRGTDFTND